ncbi:GNAT family N-acetyltransferase [Aggregatimonas sangjinii]|uniref:GNAT family N-acetyltransferase n=1 Tax=Aggregatimonas sangjinii TaxID=2583587 RepID=A0A5B7SQC5_9FLAO|nr:GNAT family N-acetyltransferase [Aggregatimonas sangjinii]QCX00895.1 GNAT family N-acetyltransferase [Aggregatimonas sangjinii]
MNLQPILKNELVRIRPLDARDREELCQVAKDPKIWEQHPCKRNERAEFDTFFEESITSKGALTIIDNQADKIIGSSRYKRIDDFHNGIEIGWTYLSRDYWGGLYNASVKHLMMRHAFQYVDHVVYYVHRDNIRSQKAVQKLGGILINATEQAVLSNSAADVLSFVVKKEAYQKP